MLKPGLTYTLERRVERTMTADAFASGAVPVFATPMMVALMEEACARLCKEHLQEGLSTVGIRVNVAHSAATPVGMNVTICATLKEIDRKRLVFVVSARDEREQIGAGTHERFIIDVEKFLQKAQAKLNG